MAQHRTPPVLPTLRIDAGRPEFISETQFGRTVEAWQGASKERRAHALRVVRDADRHLDTLRAELAACPEAKERIDPHGQRWFQLLNVGSALLELDDVDRLFHEGRLCWDKLVLLARVATAAHEAAWVQAALSLDARALGALVARSEPGGPPCLSGAPGTTDDVGGDSERIREASEPGRTTSASAPEPTPVARSVDRLARGLRRLAGRIGSRFRARRWVRARLGACLAAPRRGPKALESLPNVRRRLRERLSGA